MKSIRSYLTFNGNCREAMEFYQECLGGKLVLQTVGESPLSEKLPEKMKKSILHATLTSEGMILLASDMVGAKGLIRGNAVSLLLDCGTEEEARRYYEMLSKDGTPTHPLEHTFWNALFGDLTDKFGIPWLIHYQHNGSKTV